MDFWPVVGYALVAFHGPPLEVSTQGTPGWRGLPKSTPTAPRPVKSVKTSTNEKLSLCYFFTKVFCGKKESTNHSVRFSVFLPMSCVNDCPRNSNVFNRQSQWQDGGKQGITHFDENISLIGAIVCNVRCIRDIPCQIFISESTAYRLPETLRSCLYPYPTVQFSNLADFYVYLTLISLSKMNLYHRFKLWSRSARFRDDLQI